MHKTVTFVIISLILLFPILLQAQGLDYSKIYSLKMPDWGLEEGRDYEAKMVTYEVTLNKSVNQTFLINPVVEDKLEKWLRSIQEPFTKGWIGNLESNNEATISGVMTKGYGLAVIELTGNFATNDSLSGKGIMHVGVGGESPQTPFIYKFEWSLEPEDTQKPLLISNKVTYHGPPVKPPREPKMTTLEEEAKRPHSDDLGIKTSAGYEPKFRKRIIKNTSKKLMLYYDTLLSELTWDEIKYTPGILLLIDHLATLEEADQRRIAEGYVKDGSIDFFGNIPYTELEKAPPLFLTLKVLDQMKESDVEGLKETSPRFLKMLDVYEMLSLEELSDLSLTDFVIRISQNLPKEFRKEYFEQSPKLRNLVSLSGSSSLKGLYSFKKD